MERFEATGRNREVNLSVNLKLNLNLNDRRERSASKHATVQTTAEHVRMLSVHRLDAYQVANQFLALALAVVRKLPRGHADDADQLRRAAKSVVRNIAEGAGRTSAGDKASRYAIARGEAMECAASLDVMRAEGTVTDADHAAGITLLTRMVAMLTGLVAKPE